MFVHDVRRTTYDMHDNEIRGINVSFNDLLSYLKRFLVLVRIINLRKSDITFSNDIRNSTNLLTINILNYTVNAPTGDIIFSHEIYNIRMV